MRGRTRAVGRAHQDSSGNFFGTTLFGGAHDGGTVFELVANARKTKWKYRVIHSFCDLSGCADGHEPNASLIMDVSGNLFGTNMTGGANNGGVVYELRPNARKTKWTLVVRYSFCAATACADGWGAGGKPVLSSKATGASYDGRSTLYGTTFQGGAHNQGAVLHADARRRKRRLNEQVIYSVLSRERLRRRRQPRHRRDARHAGNIFGTTYYGGQSNQGTVFELSATPGKSKPPHGGADGPAQLLQQRQLCRRRVLRPPNCASTPRAICSARRSVAG